MKKHKVKAAPRRKTTKPFTQEDLDAARAVGKIRAAESWQRAAEAGREAYFSRLTQETCTEAFSIASDMEDDVAAAQAFAFAVAMLAEILGPDENRALQHLAWAIKDHCEAIEESRGMLCSMLHSEAFPPSASDNASAPA
jgi:hypothetical protein